MQKIENTLQNNMIYKLSYYASCLVIVPIATIAGVMAGIYDIIVDKINGLRV